MTASINRQEALHQFKLALKAGQKCYRDCVHRGRDPYPQVLEELLQGGVVAGRVDLGELEIPIAQIVGMNTAGRQTAFAANFMPLLDLGTEFASKWISLCEAHLGDTGIVDPIRCFEYMGQFYVQEGNKRVSVLRSFGAPTIRAYVTRVLPLYSDDPAVRVYYEFLHFYERCGLYQVHFNRLGDYPKLQAALGFDAEHVWSQLERRAFLTAFYTFKTAYDKLTQSAPPVTTAEALLTWLHAYTLGDLRVLTQAELERSIRAIWPELEAVAQGGKIAVQTEAAPEPQSLLGRLTGFRGCLRAAFVYECAPEASPWIAAHEAGRRQLVQALGEAVDARVYLVTDYPSPEDALEQAAADGAQVVFTTTVPLIFACRKLAPKYPGVRFLNCSVDMPYPGVRTYYSRIYEAKFLLGALAGTLAEDARIGYVADAPVFGTPAAINAFALGAQLTRPDAQILLRGSCCEQEPAAELAAEGLGMICAHALKRPGQENGWRGLCRVEDGKPRREALPIRNWGEIYIRLARSILRGGWDELNAAGAINYWWGFASGAVDVQLAPSVPDGPRELLRVLREALVHGELTPFHRRITDQAGTLRNDGEQWFSPETILRMDWLCSNVTGRIPDYEELLPMAQPMVRLLGVYRDALQPKKRGPLL